MIASRENPLVGVQFSVRDLPLSPDTAVVGAEPPSDHSLMIAVRAGEVAALGLLFERHHRRLYGFLFRLTGNRSAAQDILQTVFHRMLKYRHTYRDDGQFAAWMYKIARQCWVREFQKSQRVPQAMDPADLARQTDPSSDAGDAATVQDDRALLHVALAELTEDDREVLLLSRFEELSYQELGDILGCSAGAARVRAHRAFAELRDIFLRLQDKKSPV